MPWLEADEHTIAFEAARDIAPNAPWRAARKYSKL